MVSFEDFKKIELKAAKILKAEDVPGKDKLLKLEIDLGEAKPRVIVSGLKPHYSAKDLVGKMIVVVANLAPAKIAGIESNGMLLAADVKGEPILLSFDKKVQPGSVVM